MRGKLVAVAFLLLMNTAPLPAHHSFSATFDRNKPFKATGVVTRIDWQNPHVWFYIDVRDENAGKVVNWGWEMGSPNGLTRRGWTRESMKVGDTVTAEGSLARDGSNTASARTVTLLSTGEVLFGGSSGD